MSSPSEIMVVDLCLIKMVGNGSDVTSSGDLCPRTFRYRILGL
jgi:hypothetical protein